MPDESKSLKRLREVQKELRECRRKLKQIEKKSPYFDLIESNIHDVIAILDQDLKKLYISPSIYWQRGYTVEEALKQPFSETISLDSMRLIRQALIEELPRLLKQRKNKPISRRLELTMYRKDGSEMIAEVDVTLHLDQKSQSAKFVSVTRDITQRMMMEKALRDSEHRYRALFTDSLEALSIVKDGKILNANGSWLQLHGYSDLSEVINRNILDFIHPSSRPDMKMRRREEHRMDVSRLYEMMDVQKDGTAFYVEVKSNTILIDGTIHILSSVRDISAIRKAKIEADAANQALQDKTNELQVANRELSRYAFAVSHELKSPVRSAYSLVSLLAEDLKEQTSPQQKEYFTGILSSLENLKGTIDSMLEISKVSAGSHVLKPVSIKTIIADVFRRVQNLSGDLNLPVEWPVVTGDPALLIQVLANLISNGFKFNKSKTPKVQVFWRRIDNGRIELTVEDNGIGIDEAYIDTIFDSFKRLHTREEYDGSGIGLTIVQRAVQLMRGSIRVESIPKNGSRFIVTLQEHKKVRKLKSKVD